ncbi:MAG: Sau3AI family type II restriction endonuclease [Phascolarctobacterium sp.]
MDTKAILPYDNTNPLSIEKYAKQLIGMTFAQVLKSEILQRQNADNNVHTQDSYYYESKAAKGSLGHLLEQYYFHYNINSDSDADFSEAGVELKATPFKKNKNGSYSAKERLVITMIDYLKIIDENFYDSHLWKKCNLILLIYYEYIKALVKLDYTIKYVQLFHPPEEDLKIIQQDYQCIIEKIKAGKAHELSEGDTLYLGACTKGATAVTSIREQPFSDIKAKQRAFCFKTSYMTYVLNNYIIPGVQTYSGKLEKIQYKGNFIDFVTNSINSKIGYSVADLLKEYNITYSKRAKNLESRLVFNILGIKSNNAEEFVKAGIVVKTIRFESDDKLKETVSFPAFEFMKLAQEQWEDAEINNYLSETKFLFVCFKKDKEYDQYAKNKDYAGMDRHLRLYFAAFWNMPQKDIDEEVHICWQRTKNVILNGIKITAVGNRRLNNFPKISESRVCHVRPHARTKNDTFPLPGGGAYTKQSFFLNNTYVREQILKYKPK